MRKIGIFICNYNGEEYIIKCIESLKKQSIQDFDIFVIDNASIDRSIEIIEETYKDSVYVLKNEENLGGAGGFDRGLKHGIEQNYEYITLLDNDIYLDPFAIENLYKFLQANNDVGIVGAKIYYMDAPKKVMDFGSKIDFENYKEIVGFRNTMDHHTIPEVLECDYVPACAAMTKRSVLMECGTMPTDCFIYFDDIELCYRMKLKGYKVAAYGKAKVWHKGGGSSKRVPNTFGKYYNERNRWNFFAKYIPEEEVEKFSDYVIDKIFPSLFGLYRKENKALFKTNWYIFNDFIQGIRGKARPFRIQPFKEFRNKYSDVLKEKKCILVRLSKDLKENSKGEINFWHLIQWIMGQNPSVHILIEAQVKPYQEECYLRWDLKNIPEILLEKEIDLEKVDLELIYCEHVSLVNENVLPAVYIDKYFNLIIDEEDYIYYRNYKSSLEFFRALYKDQMIETIKNLHHENKSKELEND